MNVRRFAIVGLIVATGIVVTGSTLAASTRHGTPASAERGLSAKNTKPLTKAQFITQGNALCDSARMAFVPVLQQFAGIQTGTPTPQQLTTAVTAFAPIVQNQITKTRALKPPKRDQSKVTKILAANQDALNKLKADPQLLGAQHSPFLAADSLARAYGLEDAAGSGTCVRNAGQGGGGGQGSGGASASTPASS